MASAYTDGLVYLCDSLSNSDDDLPSTIELQLAMIYRDAVKDKELAVTSLSVQQQKKGYDCGVFAIAFMYHMARQSRSKQKITGPACGCDMSTPTATPIILIIIIHHV